MERGKFIVIEGGDGAGKDTQVDLLRKGLGSGGIIYTRDPGGTKLGSHLREIVQYEESIAKETETLVFLASRAQLVQEVIRPNIERGVHVICNRFNLSTIAYQMYGRERMEIQKFVREADIFVNGATMPDLVVLLDVPPEVGLIRIAGRAVKLTRFEKEKIAFHERVRQGYLEGAKEFPHVEVVDASRSIEEVYKDVKSAVDAVLKS